MQCQSSSGWGLLQPFPPSEAALKGPLRAPAPPLGWAGAETSCLSELAQAFPSKISTAGITLLGRAGTEMEELIAPLASASTCQPYTSPSARREKQTAIYPGSEHQYLSQAGGGEQFPGKGRNLSLVIGVSPGIRKLSLGLCSSLAQVAAAPEIWQVGSKLLLWHQALADKQPRTAWLG